MCSQQLRAWVAAAPEPTLNHDVDAGLAPDLFVLVIDVRACVHEPSCKSIRYSNSTSHYLWYSARNQKTRFGITSYHGINTQYLPLSGFLRISDLETIIQAVSDQRWLFKNVPGIIVQQEESDFNHNKSTSISSAKVEGPRSSE